MEFEVNLNRWEYLTEQMQECRRKLLKNRAALEEQLQNFGRNLENQEMQLIRKKICRYAEALEEQEKRVGEMLLVLERIETYYTGCEEQVIEAIEVSRKRFSENIQQVELNKWKVKQVLLKK